MKRNNRGELVMVVNGSGRPAMSCKPCREKKRRCDRKEPCANCTLRSMRCEYPGQEHCVVEPGREGQKAVDDPFYMEKQTPGTHQPTPSEQSQIAAVGSATLHPDDVLHRLRRLEGAVFKAPGQPAAAVLSESPENGQQTFPYSSKPSFTPFGAQVADSAVCNHALAQKYVTQVTTKLPPVDQARHLFKHFATVVQPNWGVMHVPSSRDLLERLYKAVLNGEEPPAADLLLVFSIFAGAAFSWTPQLLEKVGSTRRDAQIAGKEYSNIAQTILGNPHHPITASTTALVAISCLAHISTHFRGLSDTEVVLRMRTLVMCRSMGIDRLDSSKTQEERRLKGCNMIEVEVQRRAWWNLIGFDWLSAFSGGPNEGSYCVQFRHMNVNYPSNTEDDYITENGITRDFPLSVPTSLSAFIFRLKMADVSREAVDKLPSLFHDGPKNEDYNVVLELDGKFRALIDNLPQFLQLDPDAASESRKLSQDTPIVAMSRLGVNFGVQTRVCRLHRPYYLDSSIHPEYVYSHDACIRAAQNVLDLRRLMDEVCEPLQYRPSTSWIVMQHVSIAALILAMDVSFNPSSPGAESNKAKVLATCHMLERSVEESGSIMEGVQRNIKTLMSTLQKNKPDKMPFTSRNMHQQQPTTSVTDGEAYSDGTNIDTAYLNRKPSVSGIVMDSSALPDQLNFEMENWDQVWTDFLALAPELNGSEWDMLLDDIDFG